MRWIYFGVSGIQQWFEGNLEDSPDNISREVAEIDFRSFAKCGWQMREQIQRLPRENEVQTLTDAYKSLEKSGLGVIISCSRQRGFR